MASQAHGNPARSSRDIRSQALSDMWEHSYWLYLSPDRGLCTRPQPKVWLTVTQTQIYSTYTSRHCRCAGSSDCDRSVEFRNILRSFQGWR